jgi:hypothetical protein
VKYAIDLNRLFYFSRLAKRKTYTNAVNGTQSASKTGQHHHTFTGDDLEAERKPTAEKSSAQHLIAKCY